MRYTVVILILLTLAACGGASSEQRLARAKYAIEKTDYLAATGELQNALELDTNSAEIRWLLGKVYLETGNILEAQYELQQAQSLGWTNDDIRPALAQTLLAQGKFQDVLALDYRDLNSTAAAQLLSTQALAAVSDNQAEKAQALVALALRKEPQLLQAKLAEATLVVHRGDMANAMLLIDAILQSTPESGAAWGLKGQALGQQGKLKEARAAFDKSITHSHIAFADRIARALINLQLQDYAAAQVDATQLLQLSPQDPVANYIQGLLHFQHKQYRKALTALTLAEPAAEQFPLVLYYLSMGYLIEKDLDLAATFGNRFVTRTPDDARGRKLLAVILILQNKLQKAQDFLQPVLDHDPDEVQALNIMANALLLDKQADKGLLLYARIAQLRPDWRFVPLRQEAGLVTSVTGEEVIPVPATAPDMMANFPQTDILLILNFLGNKDFQGAIEAAKSYQYRDLESLAPYAVLARVYLAAGKPAEAKGVYDKALKRDPGDPAANQGLALLAANDPNTARQFYQTILEYHADDMTTQLQLAALESRQKNVAAMVSLLRQAIAAHRHALEPRLSLAGHYLGSGRPEKVAPLFAKLTALQQQSPRVLEITALAQLALQQHDKALVSLQQLVDTKPETVHYHYLLAMVASETGDQQKAKQELMEVIKRDPQHVLALINLARIAHNDGEQRQFEEYLATLVERAPEIPDVLRLRALAEKANGKAVEALVLSQRAFKQAPTTQTVLELNTYQKAAGRTAAARSTLLQWIAKHPADVDARLALANEFELENNLPGARAQYFVILAQQPNNIQVLNNLAWSLRLENPVNALATIRRAVAIAPGRPDLLDTLAVIEHLAGDHAGADRDIQRALEGSPGNVTMRFHQAMIAAARGEKDHAIAILEELLARDGGAFPERAEAEKLLLSLKG